MDFICNYLQCLHYFYTVVGQHVKVTLTTDHDNIIEPYLKKNENFKCISQS